MKPALTLCLGLGMLLAACGHLLDPVVAEVGSHRITASALRTFVEELPAGLRSTKLGDAARQHYLQSMIDSRLLLLEARALGLDTTRTVRAKVRDAVDVRVRYLYRVREITSKIQITEAEARNCFHTEGFDRERKVSGILVGSRAALDTVFRELQAGRPFAEVARARSLDERSVRQGGELGFIGRDMAPRIHIPPEVFRSLPLGELSGPLPSGKNWHVVRFTEERSGGFDEYYDRIRAMLSEERQEQRLREHLEQLTESFQARLKPGGLRELLEAYRQRDLSPLDASQTPLYTWAAGQILVGEVAAKLQERGVNRGFADSAQATSSLDRLVLNPFLMEEAARRAGLYDEAEIRQLAKSTEEGALLEALWKLRITASQSVSEAEVRQYYDSHPKVFQHEPATWLEELLLPTEDEAWEVRRQIEAGALFESLVDRSLRENGRANAARIHLHPRGKALFPKLFPAVMEHRQGDLVGPVEAEGGYSVFRVLGYEGAGIESYESARRRALALVNREHDNQALQALVEDLRRKYASRIVIHASRLLEALPDSLVHKASLVQEGT
jgi:parvulin-like peptidyl-prolyl isomerase